MAPSLPDLPVELVGNIVKHLPTRSERNRPRLDLLNLRRDCRELNVKTIVLFGEEFFSHGSIRVRPMCFSKVYGLITHDIFRDSIKELHIDSSISYDDRSVQQRAARSIVRNGTFARAFDVFLKQARQLTRISFTQPSIYGITSRTDERLCTWWWQIIRDVFSALYKNQIYLKYLRIGRDGNPKAPTSVNLLQSAPNSFFIFNQLETLELHSITEIEERPSIGGAGLEGTQVTVKEAANTQEQLSTFNTLLANASKLKYLHFSGDNGASSGAILGSISNGLRDTRALTTLDISHLTITEGMFINFVNSAPKSLQTLHLWFINLSTGRWKQVLTTARNKWSLSTLSLGKLNEGSNGIWFELIAKEQADVCSRSVRCENIPDPLGKDQELSIEHIVSYEYLCVDHKDPAWANTVFLSREEYDDVDMWLEMIIERYNLSEWRNTIFEHWWYEL